MSAETHRSTESDLQLLLDKIAIRELVGRWCRAADVGDGTAVAAMFVEDGVFEVAGHDHHVGRDRIAAITGATDQLRHVTADSVITIDEDRATHVSTVLLYRALADRSDVRLVTTGTYSDELVRTDVGWMITRRTVRTDLASEALRVRAFGGGAL